MCRYAPDGEVPAIVPTDAPRVSSRCLAGPDRSTLPVTSPPEDTAGEARARYANAGRGLRVRVEVTGTAAAAWGSAA